MQPKKASILRSTFPKLYFFKKPEASIYPDTTGTIKELAAFWYNFTYIEVPPSLQTLIRNEARQFQQQMASHLILRLALHHVFFVHVICSVILTDTYSILYEYIILYFYLMYFIIVLILY